MVKQEVVLVTAGAKRIGAYVCRRLVQDGYRVVIHYHQSKEAALALQEELSCAAVQADLTKIDTLEDFFQEVVDAYGQVHHVINNASLFVSAPIQQTSIAQYEKIMSLHATAPFFLAKYLYLHRLEQGGVGSVINIVDTKIDSPTQSRPAYYCAKGALFMQTKALSAALGPVVRCNAISPGAILSNGEDAYFAALKERLPLKTTGAAEDLYQAVDYLLRAGFVTGEELVVDGGQRLL